MNERMRAVARRLAEAVLPPEEFARLDGIPIQTGEFGYDRFGMERESAALAYLGARLLYERWFRVASEGHEHVPEEGPVLITPNHSGLLPLDAAMIGVDLIKHMARPRAMRAVVDHFAAATPFVGSFLYRVGQVIGNLHNVSQLLDQGELLALFPEGARGNTKPYRERYRLRPFHMGFVELSLRYRAPIVPTAVIGAEEQAPILYDVKPLARLLGLPAFPITPTFPLLGPLGLVPYPVRYHIVYGAPFRFFEDYGPETVERPEIVRRLAETVQLRVQEMVDEGQRRWAPFALGAEDEWRAEQETLS